MTGVQTCALPIYIRVIDPDGGNETVLFTEVAHGGPFIWSPDGTKVAFTSYGGGKAGIWVSDLESLNARILPGTEGAQTPFWSPDSKSLAYSAGNRMMRVDLNGGPSQVVCESKTPVGSGIWIQNGEGTGEIYFGGLGSGPLQKVAAAGGIPTAVTRLEGAAFHTLPSLLPDGKTILYFVSGGDKTGMYARRLDASIDDAPLKQIAQVQVGATFAEAHNEAGGVLFFVRQATLMAQPFDAKALTLAGEPVPVVQQIGLGRAHAHFSVTSSGIMAYRIGAGPLTQLTVADRAGASLQKLGEPNKILTHSWSPDESQVAIFRSEGT